MNAIARHPGPTFALLAALLPLALLLAARASAQDPLPPLAPPAPPDASGEAPPSLPPPELAAPALPPLAPPVLPPLAPTPAQDEALAAPPAPLDVPRVPDATAPATEHTSSASAASPVPAEPPWPPSNPCDTRVALAGGVGLGGWGGGVALRVDIGLGCIEGWSSITLGVDVLALVDTSAYGNTWALRLQSPVALTAGWRVRVAPHVELGARGGASVAVPYETLVDTGAYRVGLAIRGVAGVFTALRVARSTELVVGADLHVGGVDGAGEIVVLTVGARV